MRHAGYGPMATAVIRAAYGHLLAAGRPEHVEIISLQRIDAHLLLSDADLAVEGPDQVADLAQGPACKETEALVRKRCSI